MKAPLPPYIIKGVLPVLLASTLWALGYFIRKLILIEVLPVTLTWLTAIIVSVFLYAVFRPSLRHLWRVFRAHPLKLSGLAFCGVVLGTTFMYYGLMYLDLGVATILEKLQPLFILLLAGYFLKERLPLSILPYCAVAVISSWFIVGGSLDMAQSLADISLPGLLAITAAALSWAVASVIGRSLMHEGRGLRSRDVTLIRFILATLFITPAVLWQGHGALAATLSFEAHIWFFIVLSAMGATGCGYLLYYVGVRHISAPTAGFLELITPVVAVILGLIFLHEALSSVQIIFISLMLFSIFKITTVKKE